MSQLHKAIKESVAEFQSDRVFADIPVDLEYPPDETEADYAITLAMKAGSMEERPPREIAEELGNYLEQNLSILDTVEIAGPGFVNLSLKDQALYEEMKSVLGSDHWTFPSVNNPRKILIEFVSANPTGPLHVGHGRGAVYGDVLARLLSRHGHQVTREYYVNDAGKQMERLAESLHLRSRQSRGESVEWDDDHYRGDYLAEIVEEEEIKPDQSLNELAEIGRKRLLEDIFQTLTDCRIQFDHVSHEAQEATEDRLDQVLARLEQAGHIYEQKGATFLRTTDGDDDKDRVLIRGNGNPTYFANDLVYHDQKFERGFEQLLDIWGHDHHGYQQRLLDGLEFLGYSPQTLEIELYQLVELYRGGEPVSMSTRGGEFEPLDRLLDEVGVDAVRFNFLTTNHHRPLDFDIDVALSESEENPVYYVQYAHTRMAGILRNAEPELLEFSVSNEVQWEPEAHELLVRALDFPYHSLKATRDREPHQLTYRLRTLAGLFHTFYTQCRVIDSDRPHVSARRLQLVRFLKSVFSTGLELLGVSAPERM